eukprot:1765202-Amphidinium_carterae.1
MLLPFLFTLGKAQRIKLNLIPDPAEACSNSTTTRVTQKHIKSELTQDYHKFIQNQPQKWRLASVPAKPNPEGYFDGLVYDRGEWNPMYNFTAHPGESLIFPPGFIHEGLSVGEECVSSITYQFVHPAPVAYWRSFWPRLRRTKVRTKNAPKASEIPKLALQCNMLNISREVLKL